jgi:predicted acetyltransferase
MPKAHQRHVKSAQAFFYRRYGFPYSQTAEPAYIDSKEKVYQGEPTHGTKTRAWQEQFPPMK